MNIYFEDLVVTEDGILKIKDNCENGFELRWLTKEEAVQVDKSLERLRAVAKMTELLYDPKR